MTGSVNPSNGSKPVRFDTITHEPPGTVAEGFEVRKMGTGKKAPGKIGNITIKDADIGACTGKKKREEEKRNINMSSRKAGKQPKSDNPFQIILRIVCLCGWVSRVAARAVLSASRGKCHHRQKWHKINVCADDWSGAFAVTS